MKGVFACSAINYLPMSPSAHSSHTPLTRWQSVCRFRRVLGPAVRAVCFAFGLLLLPGTAWPQADAERVPELIEQLKSKDEYVRWSAVEALGQIGPAAQEAVPALIAALKDSKKRVRQYATYALAEIGPATQEAIPSLIEVLKGDDSIARQYAIVALRKIGPAAVPPLIEALKDKDRNGRWSAAGALGNIGPAAIKAVPSLIEVLKDPDATARWSAAAALGDIGPAAQEAVPALIAALNDSDPYVRQYTAEAFGEIGLAAKEALPGLVTALNDADEHVRWNAADALEKVAKALDKARDFAALPVLKQTAEAVSNNPDEQVKAHTDEIVRAVEHLELQWWARWRERVWTFLSDHPILSSLVAFWAACLVVWSLLLGLRPLWLLGVSKGINSIEQKMTIPIPNFPLSLPLRHFLLLSLFHYRSRVLDHWVKKHLPKARSEFDKLPTVEQHRIHLSIPSTINGDDWDAESVVKLQEHFDGKQSLVLVRGEGGAGKTSMSCLMAKWAMEEKDAARLCRKHAMIPVMLESGLLPGADGKPDFLATITGRLQKMLGDVEVPRELLIELLKRRRLLVSLDSFSEWDEPSRCAVNPVAPDFVARAMVVTSRLDEWKDESKTTIQMERLSGDRLARFMRLYIERLRQKQNDPEQDAAAAQPATEQSTEASEMELLKASLCVMQINADRRLDELYDHREITVLIARLFADEILLSQIAGKGQGGAPTNFPELMERHVVKLNRNRKEGSADPDNDTVKQAAKIVSWQYLKEKHFPHPVNRDVVLKALREEWTDLTAPDGSKQPERSREDAEKLLAYLEKPLGFVRRDPKDESRIRVSLDPVAEYLAGLYVVEKFGGNEQEWSSFLEEAKSKPGAPESIRGFMLAVRECCEAEGRRFKVPETVSDQLAQLAGMNPEAIKEAKQKQRLHRLIEQLRYPEASDRKSAAALIGEFGPAAKDAVPELIEALKDQDKRVLVSAVRALMQIGPVAQEAVPELIKALKDSDNFIRQVVIEALERIDPVVSVPAMIEALKDADSNVWHNTMGALARIGPKALPKLIEALNDANTGVRWKTAVVLGRIGPEADEAVPALIKALKDAETDVRQKAVEALGRIRQAGNETVLALAASLKDSDKNVRLKAVEALENIGPAAKEAVPALIEVLKDTDNSVRWSAKEALGKIGPATQNVVPSLIELLKDADIFVRRSAVDILQQIEGEAGKME